MLDPYGALGGVFCSGLTECFIAAGHVLESTDPSGGAKAWKTSRLILPFGSTTCPTTTLCVGVSNAEIFTTTDLSAGPRRHAAPGHNDLVSIACPSASLCLIVGYNGTLCISTHPAIGKWRAETIDDGENLYSISCPSLSLCVAVDDQGQALTSTDPTGGPSTWKRVLIDGNPCNYTTPCSIESIQASDHTGVRTVDSIDRPGNGPFLTGLKLTGDVLSWKHNGTRRTLALTP